jgi:hypothetical protein
MSKRSKFPEGWDDARVKRVLEHYESQTEEQAVAEESRGRAEESNADGSAERPRSGRARSDRQESQGIVAAEQATAAAA